MADLYDFPPADNTLPDTAARVISYQEAACSKDDPSRLSRFLEYEEARFTIGSRPWMATPPDSSPASPFFEPVVGDDEDILLANRNETAPILDGEAARLIGSTSEPSVTPSKETTIVHRAAKLTELALDDALRRAGWTRKLASHAKNTVDHGTSYLLGGWELDLSDLRKGPAKALACTAKDCNWFMMADGADVVPGGGWRFGGDRGRQMVEAGVGSTVSQPDDEEMFSTLNVCPECESEVEERFFSGNQTADLFGAPTQEDTPISTIFIQHYPDIDVYPIGGGRVGPDDIMSEVTIETIVPIDFLLPRYKAAGEVRPMSLGELDEIARYHPAGLEMWGYSGRGLVNDQKRWAVYRITLRQPNITQESLADTTKITGHEPLGRIMISANRTVLVNGPLMMEFKGENGTSKIPRMKLFPFANEIQNHSVHGISVFSRLKGPQKSLDAMFSQFQWDIAENGSPTLGLPMGANIEGQGDGYQVDASVPGVPNRIIRFDKNSGEPVVLGGKVTHEAWQPFTEGLVEHMQRTTAQSQLDMGKAVSSAPSASAQMYIGQRLDETRKPKGQRWAEHLSEFFSYLAEVMCSVYVERRQFKNIDPLKNRSISDFTGAELMNQTNVVVKTKPAHDTEAFQRQNIIELIGLQAGLVDLSTPKQRLKIAKQLGAVDAMAPEPNQQIADAQNEFLGFTLDKPRVKPVAKKRTDNHGLHSQTHMEDLRSDAGRALTRFWNDHELATDGWYEKFEALMAAEKKQRLDPDPKPRIMLAPDGQPDTGLAVLQARQHVDAQTEAQKIDANIPKNVQERIEFIQLGMVRAYPRYSTMVPEDREDFEALTVFLSHKSAHDWYEKEEVEAARLAAMPPPGPDSPAPAGAPPAGAPA